MAIYPDIAQDEESIRKPLPSVKIEVAADGALRGRENYSETIYQFTIVHSLITAAEKDSIQTFYETNNVLAFTFNYFLIMFPLSIITFIEPIV